MDGETKQDQNEDTVNLMEDVQTLMLHLQTLELSSETTVLGRAPPAPAGMTVNRFAEAMLFLHQYRSGKAFATVDDVLKFQWVAVEESDLTSLVRNDDFVCNLESEIAKEVYENTRKAALVTANLISTSQTSMRAGGAKPAKLLRKQFDLVAEGAHLCPKTGPDCKTDTWLYVVAVSLALPLDDTNTLLKAIRGSVAVPKKQNQNLDDDVVADGTDKQPPRKSSPATIQNTGLNRSPFNLLYMMEQKYIFDSQSCVFALPAMDTEQAKGWKGSPYSVIVLCDDQKGKPGTAALVAQRLGLTESVVVAATKRDIEAALDLLCSVLKCSAYCLDKKPPPPSANGKKLWDHYKTLLDSVRSYATNSENQSMDDRILVPQLDLTGLGSKSIVKVDLCQENEGVEQVVYPDPIILASKSSTNWTRKFGFQLIAEAEAHRDEFDPQIEKMIDVHSFEDLSSFGSRSGLY